MSEPRVPLLILLEFEFERRERVIACTEVVNEKGRLFASRRGQQRFDTTNCDRRLVKRAMHLDGNELKVFILYRAPHTSTRVTHGFCEAEEPRIRQPSLAAEPRFGLTPPTSSKVSPFLRPAPLGADLRSGETEIGGWDEDTDTA